MAIALCFTFPLFFAGCAQTDKDPEDQNQNTGTGDETGDETGNETNDYGTVAIEDVNAWVSYPASDFIPVFSEPENADKEISYEYDKSLIELDAQQCTVKALKEGTATVTAIFGSYKTEFTVTCSVSCFGIMQATAISRQDMPAEETIK